MPSRGRSGEIRANQHPINDEIRNEMGNWSWRGWWQWMSYSRFEGQFFGYSLCDQIDLIRYFLDLLQQRFYRWGYILGWIGVWQQVRSRFVRPAFLVFVGSCVAFFAMNYGRGRDNAQRIRIPEEYILELLPHLPGMARIIGKQTEEGILWAER